MACLTLHLSACGGSAGSGPWNLEPGRWWLYGVRRETIASVGHQREWQRNEGRVRLPDGSPAVLRSHGSGAAELLRSTSAGLERVAWTRPHVDGTSDFLEDPSLLVPAGTDPGGGWYRRDRTRVLERKVDAYGRLFVIDEPFTMRWTQAEHTETVETPAGRFAACTRLEGSGQGSFEGDRTVTGSRFTVKEIQWHAPGIGLVRLEREEHTDGGIIPSGRYHLELIDHGRD
jgi:hypothetical protein